MKYLLKKKQDIHVRLNHATNAYNYWSLAVRSIHWTEIALSLSVTHLNYIYFNRYHCIRLYDADQKTPTPPPFVSFFFK